MIIAIIALALAAPPPERATAPMIGVVFSKAPERQDVIDVYPDIAWRHGLSGFVVLSCLVTADGRLGPCQVKSEEPQGEGFAASAQRLATRFRVAPAHAGDSITGGRIEIPVPFQMPATR